MNINKSQRKHLTVLMMTAAIWRRVFNFPWAYVYH